MPDLLIYPLTSTGRGNEKQGKYEAWGYHDDAATIGRYYIQSIYAHHRTLSKGAFAVMVDIIVECGNKKVGITPIDLPLERIQFLLDCSKPQASRVRGELLESKLLLKMSTPTKGKGMMVILNHDLIDGYEQEFLAKIHPK